MNNSFSGFDLAGFWDNDEYYAREYEVYTSPASLDSFAESLMTFPERIPSAVSFTAASGGCQLTIGLETVGSAGHVAIRLGMESGNDRFSDTCTSFLAVFLLVCHG